MDKTDITRFLEKFGETKKKKLELPNKDITEMPDELGELTQIEYLDLSYNNLKEFPKGIFKLHNLKHLYLTRNQIHEIPAEILELKKLNFLDISYNQLHNISSSIGTLESLVTLDLSYNYIKELPLEIINLMSLKKLFLEDNPLVVPPKDVVKRGLYATMIHLAHMKKKRDATRIFIQIFNMPDEAKSIFEKYLNNFSSLVSDQLEYRIKFDLSYIDKDSNVQSTRKK
jgi:Leucine-rich repeat (LRR) protein